MRKVSTEKKEETSKDYVRPKLKMIGIPCKTKIENDRDIIW